METNTQSRSWMITAPAATYSRTDIEKALGGYDGVLGQLEEGTQGADTDDGGYRHWQLLVEHSSPIAFKTLHNKLPKAHLDMRKGPKASAIAYVTKEDTRVEGEEPIRIGEIKPDKRGKRSDLQRLREEILTSDRSFDEVLLEFPEAARHHRMVQELIGARDRTKARQKIRDVTVTYLFGGTGVGKTSYVFEQTNGFENTCRITDYANPFDSYQGEDILFLDEFVGGLPISLMLNIMDIYPLLLPARYSDRIAAYSQVIIVSNLPPWKVWRMFESEHRRALARRLTYVAEVMPSPEGGPGVLHHVPHELVEKYLVAPELAAYPIS